MTYLHLEHSCHTWNLYFQPMWCSAVRTQTHYPWLWPPLKIIEPGCTQAHCILNTLWGCEDIGTRVVEANMAEITIQRSPSLVSSGVNTAAGEVAWVSPASDLNLMQGWGHLCQWVLWPGRLLLLWLITLMGEALSPWRDFPGNPELWDVRSMNRTNGLSKWPQPGYAEGLVQGG